MRFASYFTLALSFVGAAVAIPAVKRAASDIETALSSVSSGLNELNDLLVAFPSGNTVYGAIIIYSKAAIAKKGASDAITAAQAITSLTEEEGQAIFTTVQGFVPILENIVQGSVAKKAPFLATNIRGVGGFVSEGFQEAIDTFTALETSLAAIAPADLQATANEILKQINPLFAPAVAAYSA